MYYLVEYRAFKFIDVLWSCPADTEDEAHEMMKELLSSNPGMDYKVYSEEVIKTGAHEEYQD